MSFGMSAIFSLLLAGPCGAAVLANYNFESGMPTGLRIKFGAPQIAPFPGLGSQGLLLKTSPPSGSFLYSQVQIPVPASPLGAYDKLDISFDFNFSGFQNRTLSDTDHVTLFLDAPEVNPLYFYSDGTTGCISRSGAGASLATFTFGVPHHFKISADTFAGKWSAWLDGSALFTNANMSRPGHLSSIRFNLNDDIALTNAPFAMLDNIYVASVPEPGISFLMLAGVLMVCSPRLRRAPTERVKVKM